MAASPREKLLAVLKTFSNLQTEFGRKPLFYTIQLSNYPLKPSVKAH